METIHRIKNESTIEAKKLTDDLTKKLFKHYKETPHIPLTMAEAYENITDMVTIEELLYKIIERRNNSCINTSRQ